MLQYARGNLIGFLALFVALGGTGYAAIKLPRNSVGSGQIRKGAVKSPDLHKSAVTSVAVKDRSIKAQDLAVGTLTAGPTGARGPQGAQGPQGDPGPTEGTSTDAWPADIPLVPETQVDVAQVTTHRAGRLFVSKTVPRLQVSCSAGNLRMWLIVDGTSVPGTVMDPVPSGTALRLFTLTGVTSTSLPAGTHTGSVGIDCSSGSITGTLVDPDLSFTAVVLGG